MTKIYFLHPVIFFLALIQSSVPFVHAKRSSSDIRPVSFTHETNSRNNSRLSVSSSFEKESLVAIRRIEAFLLSEESPPPRVRRESSPPCPPGNYGDSTSVLKVEALSADWRGGRAAAAQGPPPVLVRKLKKKKPSPSCLSNTNELALFVQDSVSLSLRPGWVCAVTGAVGTGKVFSVKKNSRNGADVCDRQSFTHNFTRFYTEHLAPSRPG